MGAINLCETWSSYSAGQIIPVAGYPTALAVMGAISLLALLALPRISARAVAEEQEV
jgi:hypothetical protein